MRIKIFLLAWLVLCADSARAAEFYVPSLSVWVSKVSQGLLINTTNPNWGAQNGLRRGDIIVSANGTAFKDLTPARMVEALSGPSGTKLELGVERGGQVGSLSYTLNGSLPLIVVVTEVERSGTFHNVWACVQNLSDQPVELDCNSVMLTNRSRGSFPLSLLQNGGRSEMIPPGGVYFLWPSFETKDAALGSFMVKDGLGNRYEVPAQPRSTSCGPWSNLPRSVQDELTRQLRGYSDFHWWGKR